MPELVAAASVEVAEVVEAILAAELVSAVPSLEAVPDDTEITNQNDTDDSFMEDDARTGLIHPKELYLFTELDTGHLLLISRLPVHIASGTQHSLHLAP
nr:hypothetical protein Iba_chr04dCG3710 [Ipomoea batatas]